MRDDGVRLLCPRSGHFLLESGHHGVVRPPAPFRDPQYHLASDTPQRLDHARMARLVMGLASVVEDLAQSDPTQTTP